MPRTLKASVFLRDTFVGYIERQGSGFSFQYDEDYLKDGGQAISLSLPVSYLPIRSEKLHAFFSGLVSEGWMRKVQSMEQKIDENDEFELLVHNGLDLIGAITVEPE